MTSGQKVGLGATALAVLTLVLASQSLPVMQWVLGELKILFRLPMFGAVLLAAGVGTIAPAWLPHALPGSWPAHRTKRVTRLLGVGIAFTMVAFRYPSAIGVQYAMFAGSLAYMGWTMLAGLVYRAMPDTAPPSLKDPPGGGPSP